MAGKGKSEPKRKTDCTEGGNDDNGPAARIPPAIFEDSPLHGRKLCIPHERTCSCKPNHLNCMTASQWLRCQTGVWRFSYEKRDVRDKRKHPATFPLALARQVIELFTHRGELVLDPFAGSGTTLLAARELGRSAVGFDLQEDYIRLCEQRLISEMRAGGVQVAVQDDARRITGYLDPESVSLIFTSPPYANLLNRRRRNKSRRQRKNHQYGKIEQYSQDPRDLGTLELEAYTRAMGEIFESLLGLLRPLAHCVINVPDMWWNDRRVTIHVALIEELRRRGYELRNVIIWDKTNVVNRMSILGWPSNYITLGITFEYLLDFRRPR